MLAGQFAVRSCRAPARCADWSRAGNSGRFRAAALRARRTTASGAPAAGLGATVSRSTSSHDQPLVFAALAARASPASAASTIACASPTMRSQVSARRESSPRRSCRCLRSPTDARRTIRFVVTDLAARRSEHRCPARGPSMRWIFSPASSCGGTARGDSLRQPRLLCRRSRRLHAPLDGLAQLARQRPVDFAGIASRCAAVISADSSAGTMPSLSVVHTLPSRRRQHAPALSSPAKPSAPSSKAIDEPFEADRHFVETAPSFAAHAIDHLAADDGLADGRVRRASAGDAEQVVDGHRKDSDWAGAVRASRVTMPWRSWSVSHANATSKRSFRPISDCIA